MASSSQDPGSDDVQPAPPIQLSTMPKPTQPAVNCRPEPATTSDNSIISHASRNDPNRVKLAKSAAKLLNPPGKQVAFSRTPLKGHTNSIQHEHQSTRSPRDTTSLEVEQASSGRGPYRRGARDILRRIRQKSTTIPNPTQYPNEGNFC